MIKELLKINVTGIFVLLVGMINSIFVPKLAIESIGADSYGIYAVLLGFALIPTFADLGVVPGLTKLVGSLYSNNKRAEMRAFVRSLQLAILVFAILLSAVAVVFGLLSNAFSLILLWGLALGCGANAVTLVVDIGLLPSRVGGKIKQANLAKVSYYIVNLTVVFLLFSYGSLSVTKLFLAQFLGALSYALIAIIVLGLRPLKLTYVDVSHPKYFPWKKLISPAIPEQLNKAQSAILPAIERGLMFTIGGAIEVVAYDIALRLSALVTAIPAVIAAPVIELLSTRQNEKKAKERNSIIKYGEILTLIITIGGAAVTVLIALEWAENFYTVESENYQSIAILVICGSGFNVLTAMKKAMLYSIGKHRIIVLKSLIDIGVAITGLVLMSYFGLVIIYIAVRYLGFILSGGLMIWMTKRAIQIEYVNPTPEQR